MARSVVDIGVINNEWFKSMQCHDGYIWSVSHAKESQW